VAGAWYRATKIRNEGHIRAAGIDKDVTFLAETDPTTNTQIDAAYRAKYRHYGAPYVDPRSPLRRKRRRSGSRRADHHTVNDNPGQGAAVEILKNAPTSKGPAEWFTGQVWFDVIWRGEQPSRMRANSVHFAPGARTAWHRHTVGQTLHVTHGVGLVQARDGKVQRIRPGDTIYTPPGQWHWHGAAPDHFMTHLAMWEAPEDDETPETEWGELVTDQEYHAR
jgi:quercetin dioxygenase-like cupin family protein